MADVAHSTLTTVDLHEPKGAASADAGQVYVADGSGSGTWEDQVVFSYSPGIISGFTTENAAGDPTNDIVINSGYCRDATNTEDIILAGALTKRLDAAWVAGNNAGGLDTGAIANTTYHMFVIKNPTTGVVDALFSASLASPSMPSGYTKKRRVFSFRRIAGAIVTFTSFEIAGGGLETSLTAANYVSAAGSGSVILLNVPAGVRMNAKLINFINVTDTITIYGPIIYRTNTSATVVLLPTPSGGATIFIDSVGYTDERR